MKNLLKSIGLDKINGYIFEKKLTGGKMSWTCLYKNSNDQKVVIKFLFYPHENKEIDRFKQEAITLKRVNKASNNCYPGLISDVKKSSKFDIYYFIMEYINGVTLGEYIDKCPLPWNDKKSTEMIYKIASSLSDSLSFGISHRDVHIKNIILTNPDAKITDNDLGIRFIDFGISEDWWKYWLKERFEEEDPINAFRHMGAVSSWSPEYLNSPDEVNVAHDIWGLGVLFYKFLTNERPFDSKNFGEYYKKVTSGKFNYSPLKNNGVDSFIIKIIERCFTADPKKRILTGKLTKMCYDYLNGITKFLSKNPSLKNLYFNSHGDLWQCPNCGKIMVPNGNRCTKCGNFVDDFLPIV